MVRNLGILLGLAAIIGGGLLLSFGTVNDADAKTDDANAPDEPQSAKKTWFVHQPEESAPAPAAVVISHLGEHRCWRADVTAPASSASVSAVKAAVLKALSKHEITSEPARVTSSDEDETKLKASAKDSGNPNTHKFSQPPFVGEMVVGRKGDKASGPWQLQACFYREQDSHVCKSQCANAF